MNDIEFGEKLRRARESKGMTQQSLAEKLYVTRQTVSRWECGDRFPDLLTTKKISVVLDISLDEMLSTSEMKVIAERNAIIEKPVVNNIVIVLYAFIVFSYMVNVVDMIIRLSSNSLYYDILNLSLIILLLFGLIVQIVIFTYGLIMAAKEMLSPKRQGMIVMVYYISIIITEVNSIFQISTWQMMSIAILLIIPCAVGAISSYQYLIKASKNKIWYILIVCTSIWGIIRMVINTYIGVRYVNQSVSMHITIEILFKASVYILIIYQVYILKQKRKIASKIMY